MFKTPKNEGKRPKRAAAFTVLEADVVDGGIQLRPHAGAACATQGRWRVLVCGKDAHVLVLFGDEATAETWMCSSAVFDVVTGFDCASLNAPRGNRRPTGPSRARDIVLTPPIVPWPTSAGVYFVRAGDRVKIGKAKNVGARLRDLQTSAPVALELVAVASGGLREEAAYHHRFRAWRLHGEWFQWSKEIARHVHELRTTPSRP